MKQIFIIFLAMIVGAFLWWTISPLFIDQAVNDELPDNITLSEKTITSSENESVSESEVVESEPETVDDTTNPNDRRFTIKDTALHPATGYVRVIQADGEQIIRFEDYDGTNGPDLKIYLAKDLDAKEFIDLGPARGNQGNINYGVPLDVDISDYEYVLTWCEAFGVLFDYAKIN